MTIGENAMMILDYRYQGFKIEYDEDKELFYVQGGSLGDDYDYSSPSLKKLKAMIDKDLAAKRKKFAGKEAFRFRWSGGTIERVTITSVDDDGRSCWIKKPNGSREKDRVADLFEVCAGNDGIIGELEKVKEERELLAAREKNLRANLKRVSFR